MADEALTPAEIQAAEELAKAQKELAWQLTSAGVNAATIIDPTGLSNIPAMGMSLYEGDFVGAGLSLLGLIPLAGKLSDAAKEARLGERLAVLGEKVAALTAKLNKVRKEADAAREAARLAKAGKEAKEAEAVSKTAENAVKEAKAVPHEAPLRCIPCEKAALAKLKPAEKAAIEEGLAHLDAGTRPKSLHPSGKWGGSKGTYKNKSVPKLPETDAAGKPITYKEYYLPKDSADPTFHGSRRLVEGSDGGVFYTNDHYKSFTRVR